MNYIRSFKKQKNKFGRKIFFIISIILILWIMWEFKYNILKSDNKNKDFYQAIENTTNCVVGILNNNKDENKSN